MVWFLATRGILMAAISPTLLAATLGLVVLYLAAIDVIKVKIMGMWL